MPGNTNKRFRTLIEPHLDVLFRAAYRLTRNRADAEDLVQETCVRAYAKLEEIRESGPVKAWLLRVMHNLFIDGMRSARLSPVDAGEAAAELASAAVCPQPNPEEVLDSRQHMAQLERAWSRLERGHRALLALRAEGYTMLEISGITNIPRDALTMRIYRARQHLWRCLKEERATSNVIPMEAVK